MKMLTPIGIGAGCLLLGLALGLTGCASSGYQQGHHVGASLQTEAGRIDAQLVKTDAAVSALNDLINNPQSDLRPQFKAFSAALGKRGTLAETIQLADKHLQAQGTNYFAAWDKELAAIQNEEIRRRGQDRRIAVQNQYDAVRNGCLKAQIEIGPLESDLWDIHRFLNADLTPGGLAAIKSVATRVNELAPSVRGTVSKLTAEMRTLGVAMSPRNVPQ